MIIQFPDAAERERLLIIRRVAAALRDYLANGSRSASACRRVANKAGADRGIYEDARSYLDLWCIYGNNIDLALPAHGRCHAGFDDRGDPIAWPINGGKPKSIPAWNARKA